MCFLDSARSQHGRYGRRQLVLQAFPRVSDVRLSMLWLPVFQAQLKQDIAPLACEFVRGPLSWPLHGTPPIALA